MNQRTPEQIKKLERQRKIGKKIMRNVKILIEFLLSIDCECEARECIRLILVVDAECLQARVRDNAFPVEGRVFL